MGASDQPRMKSTNRQAEMLTSDSRRLERVDLLTSEARRAECAKTPVPAPRRTSPCRRRSPGTSRVARLRPAPRAYRRSFVLLLCVFRGHYGTSLDGDHAGARLSAP